MRVFRSIREYGLNITRAGFFSGESPYGYIPALNTSLFLSANADDVLQAIRSGIPAGRILETKISFKSWKQRRWNKKRITKGTT